MIALGLLSAPQFVSAQVDAPLKGKTPAKHHTLVNSSSLEVRLKQLDALLNEQWEYSLRTNPEYASMLGDKRYNDQLRDFSQAAIDANLKKTREFLQRFHAIDTSGFNVQQKLNKDLMVRQLQEEIEGARFKGWQMPVLQNSGIHLDAPELVTMLSFKSVKDYEDYISRLNKLPVLFEQTMVQMRLGVKNKIMPPQFLLPKIARQCEDIVAMSMDASPFAKPVSEFPADISAADQHRLKASVLAAIKDKVIPAYQNFANFVRSEYAPHGRPHVGMWSLPDGAARYKLQVKTQTTTNKSAEEIHQIGLREVARIEAQMLEVAKKLGFADLKTFNASMEKNPALHPKSRQEILDLYSKYTDQMYAKIPELFGRLPKAKVKIMAVEEFREKEAAGASYNPGAADGSRPGHVMVNTGDFANRMTLSIETTALHEGVPGHHMQIAIAQELEGLPAYRQQGGNNAYVEGWALYSERLGQELGFFQDPYSFYGHLQDEMLRAIRLVVDTGLHYKKWDRQQVVDFFRNHSGIEEVEIQSETDRYIVWPGQALGYKIGQLKILELRDYANKALGAKFSLKEFHDEILGAGALPLDILETRIKDWVATKK
ncbi:DUF885 domain-containing protein [Undibacterium sp. FT137W]|uniref:DUF885 domain-containing protein n=2 Tax=Undibacterium fentianense TaxID=2828728 RepID=A0A941DYG4_9BURK|nr:DUF885 domain-containing protein [Undibacterium fentianense]